MRQLTSIYQQIDHNILIEGSRRSNVLKPGCTKSVEEPILDAHFQAKQMNLILLNSEIFCVIIL